MFRRTLTLAVAIAACTPAPMTPDASVGPSLTPSISTVVPHVVTAGTSVDVELGGFATAWTDAASVDFGAGITVTHVTAASPTGLLVRISVEPSAVLGFRTVTVTEGDSVTTWVDGFEVRPYLTFATRGTPAQGGVAVFSLTVNDPAFTFPLDRESLSLEFTPRAGIFPLQRSVETREITALLGIDVDAEPGPRSLKVYRYRGTPREEVFTLPAALTITPRTATEFDGTNGAITFASRWDTALFRVDVTHGGQLAVTSPSESNVQVALLGPAGHYSDATAPVFSSGQYLSPRPPGSPPAFLYAALYDASGTAGSATLSLMPPATVNEAEPNDTRAAAQALPNPAHVLGHLTAGEDDWYRLSIPASAIGRRLHYAGAPNLADITIDVLENGTSITPGGGPWDGADPKEFVTSALSTSGDVYVHIEGWFASEEGDYEFTLYLE